MRRRIQVEAEKPQFCVTTGITFAQADAWFGNTVQDLKLDLIYPRDNTRKYPCVVWICGGAWIQMDRSAHLAYLSVLAQQGFVVASVEYRTSNEAKFPAPLQDVKAGIRYLRAHADRFNIDAGSCRSIALSNHRCTGFPRFVSIRSPHGSSIH